MVYPPLLPAKQPGDPTVTVSAILGRQLNQPMNQTWFVIGNMPLPALR